MSNRCVLRRDRKTDPEGAEVTCSGRLFQTRAAATGKARSPTVDSRVRLTISDEDELERSLIVLHNIAVCCPLTYTEMYTSLYQSINQSASQPKSISIAPYFVNLLAVLVVVIYNGTEKGV